MARTVDTDAYPDDVILKAFWLQRHIHVHGIEGIYFMQAAKRQEAERSDREVAGHIAARLQKV